MHLFLAFDFRRGDMAAQIGAGVKTTTMFRMAKELNENSRKVLRCLLVTQTGTR